MTHFDVLHLLFLKKNKFFFHVESIFRFRLELIKLFLGCDISRIRSLCVAVFFRRIVSKTRP